MDLQMGNIGTTFLKWYMVLVLLLHEGLGRDSGNQKSQAKSMPLEHIQEANAQEDNIAE